MKGKATCPKCKKEFIVDISKSGNKQSVVCPNCNNKFDVKPKDDNVENYSWEEHGEPRKTILSAIKPRTKKPMIAVIILVCVLSIGITTAFFSEIFIESTMDVASQLGSSGNVQFKIIGYNNSTIDNANITIDSIELEQNNDGFYSSANIEPGIKEVEISKKGYKSQKTEILIIPFITSESSFELENGTGSTQKTEFDTLGCSVILVIFSVFALFSIIACLKREHFDIAIAGSFLCIFSFGFFFIGSILSIVAFVIIFKSRDEFKNGNKGKIF
jgi:predicted Zn finger-like uncharacterized protein